MERMDIHLNREDPHYTKALIEKKSQSDPKEVVIREKIRNEILEEKWAQDAFSRIKESQIQYLKQAISKIDNLSFIHNETQKVVEEISTLLRSRIVKGEEMLANIPKSSPILIITNHFGAYKLTGISPKNDLGIDIPNYDAMYPYPMYFASLYPVAKATGSKLYYISEDFPLIFGQIHTSAGFIHIPPSSIELEGGKTSLIQNQIQNAIQTRQKVAIVNFPEGGTSGKYSGMGPYDLDTFKTGSYVIAANLGIHIVPVAQYFHKKEGYQLKVFKPFIPQKTNKEGYQQLAENNRIQMQNWLDTKK